MSSAIRMAADSTRSPDEISVQFTSKISIRVPPSPLTQSVWKEKHNVVSEDVSARLTWKDVYVRLTTAKGTSHTILHGISGFAEPGTITAIMGPSGCGKSTLLDTFAGRLARNVNQLGEVRVNGHNTQLSYGMAAYVAQDDVLLGTLTVRETITYSANLRLPDHMPLLEKQAIIETAIAEMGLRDCADTPIGNWHLRGLSGGEKRRVSIAVEILTRPRLLFLDEPTSGLDSASAFFVICTLRSLARDGRTVIASVHQPSSEVFQLFDKLVLLSHGRTVYFGDASRAKEFFSAAGFPCPPMRNPSDHFLRVINSDFDTVRSNLKTLSHHKDFESFKDILDSVSAQDAIQILADTYRTSELASTVSARIEEMNALKGLVLDSHGSRASFSMQTYILTRRSTANMFRDLGYYWLRLAVYLLVTICVGSIFFRVGTTFDAINARASCMSFLTGFLTFMSVGGFPSFVEDMKVFVRERLNGHYGVLAYVVANSLSSIPFLLLISLACASIGYHMVALHPGVMRFAYFVVSLFASLLTVEGLMMAVASIVPNFLMGIVTGAGILGVFLLLAGFFRLQDEIPKPVWRYPVSYMGYNLYSFQGCLENDFVGLQFDNPIPGGPQLPGGDVLRDVFHINGNRSKWVNLAIIFALAVIYRVVFCFMIKLSEKMGPLIRATVSKYTFHRIEHSKSAASERLESASARDSAIGVEVPTFSYSVAVDQDQRTFMKVLETLS